MPPELLDEPLFLDHLRRHRPSDGETTREIHRQSLRRIVRAFSTADLFDPAVVRAYRDTLPQGTRNIFDQTWERLRDYAEQLGASLPENPGRSRVRFVHPLMPDLLTFSGYIDFARMPDLTWGDLRRGLVDPVLEAPARRVFEFYAGSAAPALVEDERPVFLHAGKTEPMREWHLRAIVNSLHDVSSGPVERASGTVAEHLVFAGVNGVRLRQCMTALVEARPRLTRSARVRELLAGFLERLERRDVAGFFAQVSEYRAATGVELPGW